MTTKEKQFEIIQNTNPMRDEIHLGIRSVSDIKTYPEAVHYEEPSYPDFDELAAHEAITKGKIIVYSSKEIKLGTFVTPSKLMANDYAGGSYQLLKNGEFKLQGGKHIYSKFVPLTDVAWITGDEGIYTGSVDDVDKCVDKLKENFKMKDRMIESILNGASIRDVLIAEATGFELTIKPGDSIQVGGDKAVVRDVLFQDVFISPSESKRSSADVEFKDEKGNYRHWQSWSDGGVLVTNDGSTYKFIKECVIKESITPDCGKNGLYYMFYVSNDGAMKDHTPEAIANFGKSHIAALKDLSPKEIKLHHMYWATDSNAYRGNYNGDTVVIFGNIEDLPGDLQVDAKKNIARF